MGSDNSSASDKLFESDVTPTAKEAAVAGLDTETFEEEDVKTPFEADRNQRSTKAEKKADAKADKLAKPKTAEPKKAGSKKAGPKNAEAKKAKPKQLAPETAPPPSKRKYIDAS